MRDLTYPADHEVARWRLLLDTGVVSPGDPVRLVVVDHVGPQVWHLDGQCPGTVRGGWVTVRVGELLDRLSGGSTPPVQLCRCVDDLEVAGGLPPAVTGPVLDAAAWLVASTVTGRPGVRLGALRQSLALLPAGTEVPTLDARVAAAARQLRGEHAALAASVEYRADVAGWLAANTTGHDPDLAGRAVGDTDAALALYAGFAADTVWMRVVSGLAVPHLGCAVGFDEAAPQLLRVPAALLQVPTVARSYLRQLTRSGHWPLAVVRDALALTGAARGTGLIDDQVAALAAAED